MKLFRHKSGKIHIVLKEEPDSAYYADRRTAYISYCEKAHAYEFYTGAKTDATCCLCRMMTGLPKRAPG